MTTLQIVLIVIGLVCLVGSFFISEKLSTSDLEEMKKMSEQELKVILDKQLQGTSDTIEEQLQVKMDAIMDEMERKSDKETNDKIMAISEYSDTVLSSMNKSHDEIVFMYDMLNDKQQKVTELTRELQAMESAVIQIEQLLDEKMEELQTEIQRQVEITAEASVEDVVKEPSMEEAFQSQITYEEASTSDNNQILSLYKEGLDEVEIAKRLGRGLGEVRLVLGLFSGGEHS